MEALLYIGLSQASFAAFVTWSKHPRYRHDNILTVWLLFIALEMAIGLYGNMIYQFNTTLTIALLLALTYMPFMYLYVKSLVHEHVSFTTNDLLHFLPFILFLLTYATFLNDHAVFYKPVDSWHDLSFYYRSLYFIYFFAHVVWYSLAVLRMIRKHQERLKESYSYTSISLTLNWLKFILLDRKGVIANSRESLAFLPV